MLRTDRLNSGGEIAAGLAKVALLAAATRRTTMVSSCTHEWDLRKGDRKTGEHPMKTH
jgi:hypothetical protein